MRNDMLKKLKNKAIQITDSIKNSVFFKLFSIVCEISWELFKMLMFVIGFTVFSMGLTTQLFGSTDTLSAKAKYGVVDLFIQTKPSAKKD